MVTGPDRAPSEGGFSLVEILIAVAILGIVALGIVGLFSHSIMVNASGYDYAQLAAVSRQTLEEMQALPFDDAALVQNTTPATWPDPTGSGRYTVSYVVNDYFVQRWGDVTGATWPAPDTSLGQVANLKRITLRVESNVETLLGSRQFVAAALRVP